MPRRGKFNIGRATDFGEGRVPPVPASRLMDVEVDSVAPDDEAARFFASGEEIDDLSKPDRSSTFSIMVLEYLPSLGGLVVWALPYESRVTLGGEPTLTSGGGTLPEALLTASVCARATASAVLDSLLLAGPCDD